MLRKSILNLTLTAIIFLSIGIFAGCEPDNDFGCGEPQVEQRDCVVIIGDSIFALSGDEERFLREFSGHAYRTYYMSGAQMEGGMNDIESQFDRAARQGKIRTLIVDGGGNDFFFGGSNNQAIIREISAAYERIFQKASAEGVENVVVQGYYTTADEDAATRQSEAEVMAITAEAAQKYGMNTVYFNPSEDPWFSSRRPAQYLIADGIHPTEAASRELARLLWDTMVAYDIEQGEGCEGFK